MAVKTTPGCGSIACGAQLCDTGTRWRNTTQVAVMWGVIRNHRDQFGDRPPVCCGERELQRPLPTVGLTVTQQSGQRQNPRREPMMGREFRSNPG